VETQQSQTLKAVPLDPAAQKVKAHWLEHRPKMAAQLQHEGKLDQAVLSATNLMSDALAEMVQAGMDYNRALEIARPMAYLPSEEDVPELPANQSPPYPTTTA